MTPDEQLDRDFARLASTLDYPVYIVTTRWFIGKVLQRLDLGDHMGHLLEPVRVAPGPGSEQLTYQQARQISPGHAP
jgi:hypothetical protein